MYEVVCPITKHAVFHISYFWHLMTALHEEGLVFAGRIPTDKRIANFLAAAGYDTKKHGLLHPLLGMVREADGGLPGKFSSYRDLAKAIAAS